MSQKTARTTRSKGNLVEQIAAKMHTETGVTVQTQVRMPPALTPCGAQVSEHSKREIDVLISASVAGYSVQFAIECKNERKPIGAEYIDAFVGKLQYVGIPVQNGIFVATSPFTKGAVERARTAGVKLRNLEGLTSDQLNSMVFGAVQSVVHLLLQVSEMNQSSSNMWPTSWEEAAASIEQHPAFYFDEEKNLRGTPFDLVWRMWCEGKLPTALGEHEVDVDIPKGWIQFTNQDGLLVPDPMSRLQARVTVVGHVVTIKGEATKHILLNETDKSMEKGRIEAHWPITQMSECGNFVVEDASAVRLSIVNTEEELAQLLQEEGKNNLVKVVTRLRLPRIRAFNPYGYMFWPPSEAAMLKMKEFAEKYGVDGKPDEAEIGDDPFDENYLGRVWDPIWQAYRL